MAYFQVLCCYVSFREGTYFCFSSRTRVIKKLPILGKSNHTHVRMVSLKDFPYNKWIVWVGNVMSPAIVMEMKTGPFQQKLPFKFGHVPYPWLWEIESMSFWVWEKKSKEWSLKKLDVQSETDFWVRLEKDGVNFKKIGCTLPETNIAPENRPLEKGIPIWNHHFQVRTVSFREAKKESFSWMRKPTRTPNLAVHVPKRQKLLGRSFKLLSK